MKRKTEEVNVRVEPMTRHSLEQIAERERLDLSDIVRRALHEHIERKLQVHSHAAAEG